MVVPGNNYFFVYILIRTARGDLDLIDFGASADILYIYNYSTLECDGPYFG